ncbi:MAG: hypothetical protein ACM3RX_03695 [Methanococcaceae archaeon]
MGNNVLFSTNSIKNSIKNNDCAVCTLPLRLTFSSILFAVLLLISSIGVYGFLDDAKEREILDEVSKITVASEQLSTNGEGSEIVMEFNLPEKVTVNFGSFPGSKNKWPADANNYFIRIGENERIYSSKASFSNSYLKGPVSFGPGKHRLLLTTKIEQGSGRLFVLISEKEL